METMMFQRHARGFPLARVCALLALGAWCVVATGVPAQAADGKKRKPPAVAPAAKAPAPRPPAFPQVGVVLTESFWKEPTRCEELVLQPDGRMLLACRDNVSWHLRLARLDREGRPEASFGGAGVALVELTYGAIALQPDGKIVAVGSRGGNQVGILRLTAAGLPDLGFAARGARQLGLGPPSLGAVLFAVTVQADGRIVAAGYAHLSRRGYAFNPFFDLAVLRLLPDGSPDPSFGDHGSVGVTFGNNGNARAWGIVAGADGSLTVAGGAFGGFAPTATTPRDLLVQGAAGPGHTGPDFGVARLLADGALDPKFGKAGKSVLVFGAVSSEPRSLTVLPDGKLLVAGLVGYQPTDPTRPVWGHGIARFTAEGLVDLSFGQGGSIDTALCAADLHARPVAVQPDGRIVLACPAADEPGDSRPAAERSQLLLMRYTADGAPDASFGAGGLVRARVLGGPVAKTAVAIQDDGGILVMCSGRDTPPTPEGSLQGKSVVALVRFNAADGSIDSSFGAAR